MQEKRANPRNLDELSITLGNSFRRVRQDMDSLRQQQQQNNDRLLALQKQVDIVRRSKEEHSQALESSVMRKMDGLDSQINRLKTDIIEHRKMAGQIKELEDAALAFDERVAVMEKDFSAMGRIVEELSKTRELVSRMEHIKLLTGKVADLEKRSITQAYLDKQIQEVTSMISTLKDDIEDARGSFVGQERFAKELASLEKRVNQIKDRVDDAKDIFVPRSTYDKESMVLQKRISQMAEDRQKDNARMWDRDKGRDKVFAARKGASKETKGRAKQEKPASEQERRMNIFSTIAIVLSFVVLIASVVSYFTEYKPYVYYLLAVAVGIFVIGIVVRIAAIYAE